MHHIELQCWCNVMAAVDRVAFLELDSVQSESDSGAGSRITAKGPH